MPMLCAPPQLFLVGRSKALLKINWFETPDNYPRQQVTDIRQAYPLYPVRYPQDIQANGEKGYPESYYDYRCMGLHRGNYNDNCQYDHKQDDSRTRYVKGK